MGFNRKPHYQRGLLLVGDSGGMVNPFNGEGIAYAMESAEMAASALAEAFSRGAGTRSAEKAMQAYPGVSPGLAVLSDTGRIASVNLRMPVLSETGIIPPGKFVSYVDGGTERIGITRSVSVDVGLPEIWQVIGVETHVEPV